MHHLCELVMVILPPLKWLQKKNDDTNNHAQRREAACKYFHTVTSHLCTSTAYWCLWVSRTHTHNSRCRCTYLCHLPHIQISSKLMTDCSPLLNAFFSVWMSSEWIIVYFATCFCPKPHPVSASTPPRSAVNVLLPLYVALPKGDIIYDLPSLFTCLLFLQLRWFCKFQAFVSVNIDIHVVFPNET